MTILDMHAFLIVSIRNDVMVSILQLQVSF